MRRSTRKSHVLASAWKAQRRVDARLRQLQAEHGHPLPSYLAQDPKLVQLCKEMFEAECKVYELDPSVDALELYPNEFFIEEYFYLDTVV